MNDYHKFSKAILWEPATDIEVADKDELRQEVRDRIAGCPSFIFYGVMEDSPNGVLAAKRAGLYCIAVPNELTRQMPFYQNGGTPDMILETLVDFPWAKFTKSDL